ncbi:eukaryotic translation initiation factor 3 subunit F [Schistocerca americana]|uniref:eukaryotic translation initiation factor 3 subunit F n=1 Tax=Schistocerca americana TaxID=7009 RepID=UPI001F4FA086|nr:eukaryotic translation initiation factor 3 subunit F [Schistocerca americana]XP_047100167.1 eukaryotic translation initiation factor 3 subunit F [Schistocerca piceifrons]XP_049769254.1 eukaryotic translation initiation factor 3 subunit F [Schistocerca cancellata]XP_049841290.1 eukaryotic translation initiation factor 3 subunit F [Schistocerca gregaria]XP_049944234.1 eukaryotic translation initiation factor 3 subunit F [Schistocerca serialis cubense]
MALNTVVKVHPVVLFQIVDAYERRNADAHRVIGTLLGTADKGTVEVTNCFCVPHKEYEDQVEAELNYAMDLFDLNRRVNPQENVVGWWATGNEVTSHSSVIHEYYARECNNPVHLTLDTTLQDVRMAIKAYLNVPIGVPRRKCGCMFTPVAVEILCYEPEVVGVQLCQKTVMSAVLAAGGRKSALKQAPLVEPMPDLAQVADAAAKLTELLDKVLAYVEDVLRGAQPGSRPPDNAIGRALLDMVNSVPRMTPEEFEEMFHSNIKDLLMVITLAQLTKTQLQLNEKLTLITTL